MKKILPGLLFIFAAITFAQAQQEANGYVKGITPARAQALGTAVVGIVSVIIGWRAKSRAAVGRSNRSLSVASIVLASIAIIVSVVHLATITGGFGTGGGKAGAIVALLLGIIGGSLGAFALVRARR